HSAGLGVAATLARRGIEAALIGKAALLKLAARGCAVASTRVGLRVHVSGMALGVHASALALTHRPRLTRGRRLLAAGTRVELVTGVGFLSICSRERLRLQQL